MRVDDYFHRYNQVPEATLEVACALLQRRLLTFRGFAEVESAHGGVIRPQVSLSTKQGQEVVRILLMRGLEEILEAQDSTLSTHWKEEVIDSINYLWTLYILDGDSLPLSQAAQHLHQQILGVRWGQPTDYDQVILQVMHAAMPLLESLRNRIWSWTPQSLYFDGLPHLKSFLETCTQSLLPVFEDWGDFYRFYMAKDDVLQFRLASLY